MTDLYKYIVILLFVSFPVSAQEYRPPSLDFDAPTVVEEPARSPYKPLPAEEVEKGSEPVKVVPKVELPPKKVETVPVEIKQEPKPASKPVVKKAETKKVVKPQKVDAVPLKEIKPSNTSSSKDISLVLTYEENAAGLTQVQQTRLKASLDGFKAKGQFHIHAYANTSDTENVGFARSLSLSRALTVREWFINNGVKAEDMTIRALGQARLGSDSLANSVEIFTGSKS